MQFDQFVDLVAKRANVPPSRAQTLTYDALRTLAERISGGEARDLAAQLPAELQPMLSELVEETAEDFDVDEFVRRVAERASVDGEVAREAARAVMLTLREAVTPGEWDEVTAQLSADYSELVGPVT
ncbi:MAG: hypothetical protein JWM01_2126 [Arthrobacter sp.]|jgi:uncharacterized protein (DUF2267 family)|nr:hypothetical protein [Arthrobacter sp.]MCU1554933.1 hypothetical protein [Arthrobacter sp.]